MENTVVQGTDVWSLLLQTGWVVKFVLFSLIGSSVICWAIVAMKFKLLRGALVQNARFLEAFWNGKNLDEISDKTEGYNLSPVARVFHSGYRELKKLKRTERTDSGAQEVDNIQRALVRAAHAEVSDLEKNVSWLATTASAAPFVGLFGTVWGIMDSFQSIGATGSANLSVVAPGIAEALIATAAGLAAAIPAVVAYNHFVNQIKRITVDMECFAQDFLNMVQRSLLGGKKK